MHAIDRLKQDLLLADEVRAVSGMERLKLSLIERQELLNAAALPDVAELEAILAAIDLLQLHAPELRKAAAEHMRLAAGDAGHMNLPMLLPLTHQHRLLMPAGRTAQRKLPLPEEIRHIVHMNPAAASAIKRRRANNTTDQHAASHTPRESFLKNFQYLFVAE